MGNSPSEFDEFRRNLKLPVKLKEELRRPLGDAVSEEELVERTRGAPFIVSVGDVCSISAIAKGLIMKVVVVDYRSRRADYNQIKAFFEDLGGRRLRIRNPAGMITEELWSAITEAYKSKERVTIEVEGEEDLATLPCVALAPMGAFVIYGLPEVGLILVKVNHEAKEKVRKALSQMEEIRGNRDTGKEGKRPTQED